MCNVLICTVLFIIYTSIEADSNPSAWTGKHFGSSALRIKLTWLDLPVSDATCAQQQLSIAPPLSLQNNVNIKLFVVYEDMLHATMEAVQLGLTLPDCVIGFRTTWVQESKRMNWTVRVCNLISEVISNCFKASPHLQKSSGLLSELWKGWWSLGETLPPHQLWGSAGCLWLPNPLYASNRHLACNLEIGETPVMQCFYNQIQYRDHMDNAQHLSRIDC